MSPKSKGRPKGRGRTPARPRSPRPVAELSPVRRTLRDARVLDDGRLGLLEVRLIASAWLGAAWATRTLGSRDPEGDLVTDLVGELDGTHGHTAHLALEALRTIASDPWRDRLPTALTAAGKAAPADQPRPAWAQDTYAPPSPERAQFWSDPWGSDTVYLLRYAVPTPHIVIVPMGTVGGVMVEKVIVEQDADPDETIGAMTLRGDVPVALALAAIADGLFTTAMYWPPHDDGDYIVNRAYAHWLTDGHRSEADWEDISDETRRELITAFQEDHGPQLAHDAQTVDLLADVFVDFGVGYLPGGVLAWSPGEVERFLLDWVQRKVVLDPKDSVALPDVLTEWVAFALRRKGIAAADIEPVVAAVDECADQYLGDVTTSGQGPAAELMKRAMAEGTDLTDQAALDRLIGSYNAEQNARRLTDS